MKFAESLAKRAADGLEVVSKAFGITWDGDAGWRSYGGGSITRYVGSDMDWALEAGSPKLWLNSPAGICLGYIFDKIVEPRIHVVYEDDEGMLQPVAKHPATELMLHPNPEYQGNALLQGLALSYKFAGNAYAMKVRGAGGGGAPVELYYIPHWLIFPIPPKDGGPTEFYAYNKPQVNGGFKVVAVPAANVIHIRDGIDPDNSRMGLDRFKSQYRPLVADNEIDSTIALILRNRGNIGTLITPATADIEIDSDSFEEFKRKVENQSRGDARGGMIATDFPIKIDRTTQSPKDLMLDQVGKRPEARICAILGIDPAAVGLAESSSGKGGQYGAKMREARSSSYETAILPTLAAMAEALTYQLLPDFPIRALSRAKDKTLPPSRKRAPSSRNGRSVLGPDRHKWVIPASEFRAKASDDAAANAVVKSFRFNFDYSEVRELSEDADATSKRAVSMFQGGIVTLDESREIVGLKPVDDEAMGGSFSFQLLSGPKGGEFGVVPGANDPKGERTRTDPDPDPEDENLPPEPDEDEE